MKIEQQRTKRCFGNDLKTFAQLPSKTVELELFKEQAMKATSQEIVDLYTMLRDKCKQTAPRLSGFQL